MSALASHIRSVHVKKTKFEFTKFFSWFFFFFKFGFFFLKKKSKFPNLVFFILEKKTKFEFGLFLLWIWIFSEENTSGFFLVFFSPPNLVFFSEKKPQIWNLVFFLRKKKQIWIWFFFSYKFGFYLKKK